MPCYGPSKDHAHEQADKVFPEVWDLLCKKYHICDPDAVLSVMDLEGKDTGKRVVGFGFFHKECKESKKKIERSFT
jgi:hypothetical protein